jgi:hypothetical protein
VARAAALLFLALAALPACPRDYRFRTVARYGAPGGRYEMRFAR